MHANGGGVGDWVGARWVLELELEGCIFPMVFGVFVSIGLCLCEVR